MHLHGVVDDHSEVVVVYTKYLPNDERIRIIKKKKTLLSTGSHAIESIVSVTSNNFANCLLASLPCDDFFLFAWKTIGEIMIHGGKRRLTLRTDQMGPLHRVQ